MSRFGKLIFTATSLAPCCWAYSVNLWSNGASTDAIIWLIIGLLLWLICWLIIVGAARWLSRQSFVTTKVKLADKEILAFLLAYLLPLLSSTPIAFKGDWMTAFYVYAVIGACVVHSNAFTFNPLLASLGYHFYEIENDGSMTYLLLTKRVLNTSEITLTTVKFSEYIMVDVGEK